MDSNIDPAVAADHHIYNTSDLSHNTKVDTNQVDDTDITTNEHRQDTTFDYDFISATKETDNIPLPQVEESTTEAALHILNSLNEQNHENYFNENGNDYSKDIDTQENSTKQETEEDEAVKLVQYNPDEKPKRLGRPRKHISNNWPQPENSSSENYNESIISKFRLDSQPVQGPGSRGGKAGVRKSPRGRVTLDSVRKRQATLNFTVSEDSNTSIGLEINNDNSNGSSNGEKSKESSHIGDQNDTMESEESPNNGDGDLSETPEVVEEIESEGDAESNPTTEKSDPPINGTVSKSTSPSGTKKKAPKLILKLGNKTFKPTPSKLTKIAPKPIGFSSTASSDTPAASKRKSSPAKAAATTKKKLKLSLTKTTSRTTVKNGRNKLTRQLPGPLVGLYYDLYDDNLSDEYFEGAKKEKIALGFPCIKSPYASDLVFIVGFLNKFKDVIPMETNLGPKDFEKGLGLPKVGSDGICDDKYNAREVSLANEEETEGTDEISPEMESLFKKLLTLVLNRKKPVTSIAKAIAELKPMSISLGLPQEWKQLKPHPNPPSPDSIQSPVDPSHPEIHISELPQNQEYLITFNPFYTTPLFESHGLAALSNPQDRLILIRTLIQWSLSTSDIIKSAITRSVHAQDLPGDKETYYAARSVLYGFKHTEETKREAEIKLTKRKDDDAGVVKYVDPMSDPMVHSMGLRLIPSVIGDLGFGIGRVFFVRMDEGSNGGLNSVRKMSQIWGLSNAAAIGGEVPSGFGVFVQDVHSMLVAALTSDGVEFDDNGMEVKSEPVEESECWYEVAKDVSELGEFVNFLGRRLGMIETEEPVVVIPMASKIYRPVLALYEYLSGILPLLASQEELRKSNLDSRATRRKREVVDYSDARASEKYKTAIEAEGSGEYIDENGAYDDDDYEGEENISEDDEDEEYQD
ncbi:uncharacterized protein J8A68_003326 [[Candida] subhashii]|uniref:Uncharacterized protein n=1 Tax=[Candida] subhashii TaxID=561895 RepID=A0A8J5QJA6_9ASCO|nr:uncharacterized protein J8A68_003326 [[Candida] subhashii]KAG7663148.1 hypothetical protein J8A68_003326 [[Candida] subhashii]